MNRIHKQHKESNRAKLPVKTAAPTIKIAGAAVCLPYRQTV
jgi:hypothetical protein